MQWYTSKITFEVKQFIKYNESVDYWTSQIFVRFKENTNVFMKITLKERYTMKNVQWRRKFRKYVIIISKIAKSTEFDLITNLVAIIYNKFDVEFQRDLIKSSNVISLNAFLRDMNNCKKIWWQLKTKKVFTKSLWIFQKQKKLY